MPTLPDSPAAETVKIASRTRSRVLALGGVASIESDPDTAAQPPTDSPLSAADCLRAAIKARDLDKLKAALQEHAAAAAGSPAVIAEARRLRTELSDAKVKARKAERLTEQKRVKLRAAELRAEEKLAAEELAAEERASAITAGEPAAAVACSCRAAFS